MRTPGSTACAVLLLAVGSATSAAELTIAEALERGLRTPAFEALISAQRVEAEARSVAAGRWENPSVEFSREEIDLPTGSSVDRFLWVRQSLDLAGTRTLTRQSVAAAGKAEAARVAMLMRERRRQIRELFHDALAEDEQRQLAEEHAARLAELTEDVRRRAERGDAARYDVLRLQRESDLLDAALAEARAKASAARAQLHALLPGDPAIPVGELLPPEAPPSDGVSSHPLLQALAAEAEAADLAGAAAARQSWPGVTVGLGRRDSSDPLFDADGPALSLEVEIPLFDRGDATASAERARSDALQAEAALVRAGLEAELAAAMQRLEALRDAALAVDADTTLSDIAEAAYRAGEIGVLALLDAHEAEHAVAARRIELALAARNAFIEVQFLLGE